jgi:hypothetical protein
MKGGRTPGGEDMLLGSPDGRFAVVTPEGLLALGGPVASIEDMGESFARVMHAIPWVNEAEARTQLAAAGLSPRAIDEQFAAAARKLAVMASQPTIMERITKVGYRNTDGQEVVRRTDRQRDGQRVFVMRCSVCGHEYGSLGCDADIRRCPACQDGAPSVI